MAAADILQSEPHTPKERSPSDAENDYRDAEKNYRPSDPKFWMIIISIYLSTSLIALDRMIIAAAIPSTTDEVHSIDYIGWYGSAYCSPWPSSTHSSAASTSSTTPNGSSSQALSSSRSARPYTAPLLAPLLSSWAAPLLILEPRAYSAVAL